TQLPRARPHGADAGMGPHARGRAQRAGSGLVDLGVPRSRDHTDRDRGHGGRARAAGERGRAAGMTALDVQGLRIAFGRDVVVDDVSFSLDAGECVAIVGESGAGKSLTARAMLGLVPSDARVT